ncbi:MAG TPA: 4'-phosphopantetheinyl transferase superfamily protein [Polyangiales bacterium]|nr:4'-phosphopantetheinyl transferase superfamily protein [Polyangiales bacterium]
MTDTLSELFARLYPNDVVGVELSDPARAEPLFEDEEPVVARAVEKRRTEFALGRTAARQALAQLGVQAGALLQNKDRSVQWPDAAWGSITHADGICAAVATLRASHAGIGIDAELRGRVKRELWGHIATEREQAWLGDADEEEAAARATLLFSAKEAFYKAQFCASRGWVGFHDAQLQFDEEGGFEVELLIDVGITFRRGQRFQGRWGFLPHHVVTGLVL